MVFDFFTVTLVIATSRASIAATTTTFHFSTTLSSFFGKGRGGLVGLLTNVELATRALARPRHYLSIIVAHPSLVLLRFTLVIVYDGNAMGAQTTIQILFGRCLIFEIHLLDVL